jgi:hypothetical protein
MPRALLFRRRVDLVIRLEFRATESQRLAVIAAVSVVLPWST